MDIGKPDRLALARATRRNRGLYQSRQIRPLIIDLEASGSTVSALREAINPSLGISRRVMQSDKNFLVAVTAAWSDCNGFGHGIQKLLPLTACFVKDERRAIPGSAASGLEVPCLEKYGLSRFIGDSYKSCTSLADESPSRRLGRHFALSSSGIEFDDH